MAPEPEYTGEGNLIYENRLEELSERVGKFLKNPNTNETYFFEGLVFEPKNGNVHLVVGLKSKEEKKSYALGGEDLVKRFSLDRSSFSDARINWGGEAGVKEYRPISSDEVIVEDNTQLGFSIGGDGEDFYIRYGQLYENEQPNEAFHESVDILLENYIGKGGKAEIVQKIAKGLDKAGLPK